MVGFSVLVCTIFGIISKSSSEVVFTHAHLPSKSECGLNRLSNRIIGGSVTEIDEFPWTVALELTNKNTGIASIKCGGSLITKRHIITAGHCVYSPDHNITHAWLGDWKLSTDPDCVTILGSTVCTDRAQKIKILRAIYHPNYNDDLLKNDIGILFMELDAQFNNFVQPICLPSVTLNNPSESTIVFSVGWGITENGASSDIKLKVGLPMTLNYVCNKVLKENLSRKQLCVGGHGGKDTCGGDSGGPLMNYYMDNSTGDIHWYLLGIVSYGYECGLQGYPAVYTRVPNYVNWIISVITD